MTLKFISITFITILIGLNAFAQSPWPPRSVLVTPAAPRISDGERQAELARRRAAVAAKMTDNSMLILFSAEPKIYSNSVDFMFRQENNLYYLTALKQRYSSLVITKKGGVVEEKVFLPRRDPATETWDGKMYSVEDAQRLSGIRNIVFTSERKAFLDSVAANQDKAISSIYLLLPENDGDGTGMREYRQEFDFSKRLSGVKVENARPIFAELRLVKSPIEIKLLQHAVDITTEAQMRSMAVVGRAKWEYEVQAEVEYTFRRRNANYWGYPSIVGCGPNATTLHYQDPQGPIKRGDLLLMDVGAEWDHYTADVTRTFPVNGKFTKEQAEIYQIVYDAQEAVARATKPGVRFGELSMIANRTIADGLFKLGLITDKNGAQSRTWFMHGLGHWLGMNVHDVGSYSTPLAAGMVFTNEPGIYIREDALDNLPDTPQNREFINKVRPAFEKYKNIGVRIEDDLLVTPTGVEWMTKKLPRKISDIEAFMAAASRRPVASYAPSSVFVGTGVH